MITKTHFSVPQAITILLATLTSWTQYGFAQDADYAHDKYSPIPVDIRRQFEAFVVSFDSKDDDDEDNTLDLLRVPEWVAQEIRKFDRECVPTAPRESWTTDPGLFASGVAPDDASYTHSGFDRGHMAAKALSARISLHADRETFTMLNSVPQMPRFNSYIWADLEEITGAWAQAYDKVWVIQGPVFDTQRQTRPHWTHYLHWIGDTEQGERSVAVPDALFKVIVREDRGNNAIGPEVHALAFIYPQVGPWYHKAKSELPNRDYGHHRFLTTIAEVEELTGLMFPQLNNLRDQLPQQLWPVSSEQIVPSCPSEEQ